MLTKLTGVESLRRLGLVCWSRCSPRFNSHSLQSGECLREHVWQATKRSLSLVVSDLSALIPTVSG